MAHSKKSNMVHASPPSDYLGTISNWKTQLEIRGIWNKKHGKSYDSILIPESQWLDILKLCEREEKY